MSAALPEPAAERSRPSPVPADFSLIRYAQCWEDADVLLEALAVRPGDTCLSIASAGDNSLSLLTRDPARVVAVDLSPAQLGCLELRVAAYRALEHPELLELVGSRPSARRAALYERCRGLLGAEARTFWDAHPAEVAAGIGSAGKFERYFRLFRTRVLPLVHGRRAVDALLAPKDPEARAAFYARRWDSWRWRAMFKVFFSRAVMGRFGRDPSFFRFVEGSVADRILERTRHALAVLDPAENPYVQWILTGTHGTALPHALRPENFAVIRDRLARLEWRRAALEDELARSGRGQFDRFNLSDVFEYVSDERYRDLLGELTRVGRTGGRLVYWNMLAERRRPEEMAARLRPLDDVARALHAQDKAFFYSALRVEELA
jgi:S-adenosylmethionine-diacylglycerol 3-amino-3-carboxypropyl transferase